jgi:hypothetical protein
VIGEVDTELLGWLGAAAGPADVELGPPLPAGAARPVVRVHLLDVLGREPVRGGQDVAHHAELRYLVTAGGDTPAAAHVLLGRLLEAALGHAGGVLEREPPGPLLWLAFGVPPQPCFVLRVPHVLREDTGDAPPVTRPLRVRTGGLGQLVGTVRAGAGVPVPYAQVRMGPVVAVTDGRGAFRLPVAGDPAGPLAVALKGRPVRAAVTGVGTAADPYVVQIQTETGVA